MESPRPEDRRIDFLGRWRVADDPDAHVRQLALMKVRSEERLRDLAAHHADAAIRIGAVARLSSPEAIIEIATRRSDLHPMAMNRIVELAKAGAISEKAVALIADREVLRQIAEAAQHPRTRLAALGRSGDAALDFPPIDVAR